MQSRVQRLRAARQSYRRIRLRALPVATPSRLGTAQPNILKSMTDAPTEFPEGIGAPATRALQGAGYSRLEELADVPAPAKSALPGPAS